MHKTTHEMKLRSPFFEKVADGSKTIEVRLYDEKRQTINLGDRIEFTQISGEGQTVGAEVIGLLRYDSFDDLLSDFPLECFGAEDKTLFLQVLSSYYSKEDERRYGVLGIRLRLLL